MTTDAAAKRDRIGAVKFAHRNVRGIFGFAKGLLVVWSTANSVMTKAVENFAPKLIILTVRRALATKRHLLFQFLLLILFLGAIGGSARAGLDIQNPPAESLGAGSPFAISDFDGDLQPDLASIQAGRNNSDGTDYWIQVHLSTAGQQFIRVVAPSGGLQIEARDVNGDHAIDLVISSAGRREPVAIFLNDGHGTFSRAEPDAFPGALDESGENWVSGLNLLRVALGVTPQSGSSIWPKEKDSLHDRPPAGFVSASNAGFPLSSFVVSHAGRAPPFAVQHSS